MGLKELVTDTDTKIVCKEGVGQAFSAANAAMNNVTGDEVQVHVIVIQQRLARWTGKLAYLAHEDIR